MKISDIGFVKTEPNRTDLKIQQESPAVTDKPAQRLQSLHSLRKSSGVVSCIARLPIDSVPMVSYYVLCSNCVCKMRPFGDTRILKLP